MLLVRLVLVRVLQLFTMALMVDRVSEAQTEMTQKARSVVEGLRLIRSTGIDPTGTVLPFAVGSRTLPLQSSDAGYSLWGPTGLGAVEEGTRYRLSYQIVDGGTDWLVTVFALPRQAGDVRYLTPAAKKGVRYAARIPK